MRNPIKNLTDILNALNIEKQDKKQRVKKNFILEDIRKIPRTTGAKTKKKIVRQIFNKYNDFDSFIK